MRPIRVLSVHCVTDASTTGGPLNPDVRGIPARIHLRSKRLLIVLSVCFKSVNPYDGPFYNPFSAHQLFGF